MATFFDGVTTGWWHRTDNYIYGKLTGSVSRSGNTVTLSNMVLYLSTRWSSTGSESQWFRINGTQTNFTVTANGTDLGSHSLNNTSFSVSASQTSASVGWESFDGYTGSFTVTFPSGTSAPTGLGANNIVRGVESFTANVYLSSWGTGSGSKYRELQCWTYDPNDYVQPRRYQPVYGDALSGNITVDNNSSYTSEYGPLTIVGNTMYTLGVYASNGSADTRAWVGGYTTLAYAPEVTLNTLSGSTAVIDYTTSADGGHYPKTYEYSIDGGTTWTTFATVSTGAASSGSFTVTNLPSGTITILKTRVTTQAGTTDGNDITLGEIPRLKIYGSVSGEAKLVNKIGGSVNDKLVYLEKLYGPAPIEVTTGVTGVIRSGGAGNITAFDGQTFWYAAGSQLDYTKTISYLKLTTDASGNSVSLVVYYTDNTSTTISGVSSASDLATYGLTVSVQAAGTDYVDLTPVTTTIYVAKRIY